MTQKRKCLHSLMKNCNYFEVNCLRRLFNTSFSPPGMPILFKLEKLCSAYINQFAKNILSVAFIILNVARMLVEAFSFKKHFHVRSGAIINGTSVKSPEFYKTLETYVRISENHIPSPLIIFHFPPRTSTT
jgi:hypothetical protein